MKTIGLIGGMTWQSTLEYYRIINETIGKKLGGSHSAKILMISVDFGEIEKLQEEGNWDKLSMAMTEAARNLEKAGAGFIVICTNTMHKTADNVQENTHIPLLHITDATAAVIQSKGFKKIGLLGTIFTMEQDFYKERLVNKYGLDVIVPGREDRQTIHRLIQEELCCGDFRNAPKEHFIRVINKLAHDGAEAVILGCTEIPLLIKQEDVKVPLLDTTRIHAEAAVEFSLK